MGHRCWPQAPAHQPFTPAGETAGSHWQRLGRFQLRFQAGCGKPVGDYRQALKGLKMTHRDTGMRVIWYRYNIYNDGWLMICLGIIPAVHSISEHLGISESMSSGALWIDKRTTDLRKADPTEPRTRWEGAWAVLDPITTYMTGNMRSAYSKNGIFQAATFIKQFIKQRLLTLVT